jgi:glycosyltransferase involved in cell wall biosynthesis
MPPLVTVAVPTFKRLHYLPQVLESVARQSYANLELLVSANGENGDEVRGMVERHYPRPFTFRANAATVPIVTHLNQLLAAASGEYFVLLCDDDTINDVFVADLAATLDGHPTAVVALPHPETMDGDGGNITQFESEWPEALPGEEFVPAWVSKRVRLMSTVTHMSRTAVARRYGYSEFPRALYSDNMLLLKLALGRQVAFGRKAVFRWRIEATSTGFSADYREVGAVCRQFLRALEDDPDLQAYAALHPAQWGALKPVLREQCANWYLSRWELRYLPSLSRVDGLRAACELPWMPNYYRAVASRIRQSLGEWAAERAPRVYALHRTARRVAASMLAWLMAV